MGLYWEVLESSWSSCLEGEKEMIERHGPHHNILPWGRIEGRDTIENWMDQGLEVFGQNSTVASEGI
jgi:hypothetical protein